MKRLAFFAAVFVASGPVSALGETQFSISFDPAVPANVRTAFDRAASDWSALLRDPVTVTIEVDFLPLGERTLGQTSFFTAFASFDAFRNVVANGGEAGDTREAALLPNLPTEAQFNVTLPPGFAWQGTGFLSTANYKALGGSLGGTDGFITFSSNFPWDFDSSDGVSPGMFDIEGVAKHEIGHVLGFWSGVDRVDAFLRDGLTDDDVRISALDLFRFDTDDLADPGFSFTTAPRDLAPGGSHSFYYGDGSVLMSTGAFNGDGKQGSHWKDDLGLGLMDPTAAPGEVLTISQNDLIALDLIGWDPVPEPSAIALAAIGLLGLLAYARTIRRRSAG